MTKSFLGQVLQVALAAALRVAASFAWRAASTIGVEFAANFNSSTWRRR